MSKLEQAKAVSFLGHCSFHDLLTSTWNDTTWDCRWSVQYVCSIPVHVVHVSDSSTGDQVNYYSRCRCNWAVQIEASERKSVGGLVNTPFGDRQVIATLPTLCTIIAALQTSAPFHRLGVVHDRLSTDNCRWRTVAELCRDETRDSRSANILFICW